MSTRLTLSIALPLCSQVAAGSLLPAEDCFLLANKLAQAPLFHLRRVTVDGQPLQLAGLTINNPADPSALASADLVLIPGLGQQPDLTEPQLASMATLLQAGRDGPTKLASLCSGAFLLAATGRLDGRRATTHWALASRFRQAYPRVKLDISALHTEDGGLYCSGGAHAGLDLCLHLIAGHTGPALARQVANALVIDWPRQSQTAYSGLQLDTRHGDTAVAQVQAWLHQHYAQAIRLEDLAAEAHLSPRTLLRRFKQATGETPIGYLQQLRIDAAKRLLETSSLSVDQIMAAVGYEDRASFGQLFKTLAACSPQQYRLRVRPG